MSTTIRLEDSTKERLEELYLRLRLKKKVKNYNDVINLLINRLKKKDGNNNKEMQSV